MFVILSASEGSMFSSLSILLSCQRVLRYGRIDQSGIRDEGDAETAPLRSQQNQPGVPGGNFLRAVPELSAVQGARRRVRGAQLLHRDQRRRPPQPAGRVTIPEAG